MRLVAKSGYKVTEEEIAYDKKERGKNNSGYLLNRDKIYWSKFIKDGALDRETILAKRYQPHQLPFIESEMRRLKWL